MKSYTKLGYKNSLEWIQAGCPLQCTECGEVFRVRDISDTSLTESLCPKCYEKERTRYCIGCGEAYIPKRRGTSSDGLCPKCLEETGWLYVSWRNNVNRVAARGGEATLRYDEWFQIVAQHEGRCVYCGSVAEAMDHALPVSRGGGTTAENCVPACTACNSAKRDKTPEEFEAIGQ